MVHDIFLFHEEENSWGTRLWHFAQRREVTWHM